MRILVFGSIRVVFAGQERPVNAAKQRALLAILVLNQGQLVPLNTIIECLWDTEPPPTAPNLVRQYVSCLRHEALCGVTDVELTTRPSGYCLKVSPDEVDVLCFEQQLQRGLAELAAGEAENAIGTARGALQLVQGPALTDVPLSPAIVAERDRIAELVVATRELQAAAYLACGRPHAAAAELKALTACHPFNERLHAQLMRALSACGRQADALSVYRTARRTMIDELGVEPGPELRQLEAQILAGMLPAPEGEGIRPVQPRTEPADADRMRPKAFVTPLLAGCDGSPYVGRDRELDQAAAALADGRGADGSAASRVAVINGPAGIGKTALAVRLSHRIRDLYPDGRLLLDLHPVESAAPLTATEALGQLLLELGVEEIPAGLAPRRQAFDEAVAGRRLLLVLDNAADEAQVQPLLLSEPGCGTVVTSRTILAGIYADSTVTLTTLDDQLAWSLFVRLLGSARIRGEEQAARAIVEMCGGLPLALRVAATRLRNLPHRSLAEFADRLRGDQILDELTLGELDVKERMEATYRMLVPDSRRVLHHLAAMPLRPRQPLSLPWLAGELGVVDGAVDRLVEAGALEAAPEQATGPAQLRCLELLRRFVQAHVRSDASAAEYPPQPRYVAGALL